MRTILVTAVCVALCACSEKPQLAGKPFHKLDDEKVPAHLRDLVPTVEHWSPGNLIYELDEAYEKLTPEIEKELVATAEARMPEICDWLYRQPDIPGPEGFSLEHSAFWDFLDFVHLRLDGPEPTKPLQWAYDVAIGEEPEIGRKKIREILSLREEISGKGSMSDLELKAQEVLDRFDERETADKN